MQDGIKVIENFVVEGRNVNDVFPSALRILLDEGVEEDSRNGKVLALPKPCMIVYTHPQERVLFNAVRDCNPFFHLMESLWMLAGRNDVAFLKQYNSNIDAYSDNGIDFYGAYGYRWRQFYQFDQLDRIVQELKHSPNSRRVVLSMWSAVDLETETKDKPCNTHAYFDLRGDKLNMTICNRSNDAIWGAFGANVVHFSFLQEYLAARLNKPMGQYTQFTNNLHVYLEKFSREKMEELVQGTDNKYVTNARPYFLDFTGSLGHLFEQDLQKLNDPVNFTHPFFTDIVRPMMNSYKRRKNGQSNGLFEIEFMSRCDWEVACIEWIRRREAK